MKQIIYLFFLFHFVFVHAQMKTIDFAGQFSTKKVCFLTDLALNVEYIKLEFSKEALIDDVSKIGQIVITDSYIFIQSRCELYMFSRTGKFIRKIGSIGKGPGEYICALSFGIDSTNQKIYIQTSTHTLMTFSFDGKHIETNPLKAHGELFYYNNKIISVSNLETAFFGEWNGIRAQTFDIKNKQEQKVSYSNFKSNSALYPSNFSYKYNDTVFTQFVNNDTVFYLKDNKFIPQYILNMGKYRRKNIDFSKYSGKNFIYINKVKESKNFLFMDYFLTDRYSPQNAIYQKNTGILYSLKDELIINDLDGGMNIWPKFSIDNNKVAVFIDIFDIFENLDKNYFASSTAKYPEKKLELMKLINSLNENDNPIIMLIHLK